MPIAPPDFDSIFTEGMTFTDDRGRDLRIEVADIGELSLPTGQVCACDPFVCLDGDVDVEPFTATVAPGRYRVQVARAQWLTTPGRQIAAARLVINPEPAASWDLALRPGQIIAELQDGFFGYGVDTGSGCFIDPAAAPVFAALNEGGYGGPAAHAFDASDDVAVGTIATSPDGQHTIAVFSSGWGDGGYPTWVGRAADGDICCFVTEFFVVPDDRVRLTDEED